jgi:hypothetical protein
MKPDFNLKIVIFYTTIVFFNLILIYYLMHMIYIENNDKAQILFLVYYPALSAFNGIIGLVLKFMKLRIYLFFVLLFLIMLLLFIPLYAVVIIYL